MGGSRAFLCLIFGFMLLSSPLILPFDARSVDFSTFPDVANLFSSLSILGTSLTSSNQWTATAASEDKPLEETDKPVVRSFSYPIQLFEGETVSEISQTITWDKDGSVQITDDRGNSFIMSLPVNGSIVLLENSKSVVQRVSGDGIKYEILWKPLENSEGIVDRYKFTIEGTSEKETEIKFSLSSSQGIIFNDDKFLVSDFNATTTDSSVDKSGEESELIENVVDTTSEILDPDPANDTSTSPNEEAIINDLGGIGIDWSDAVAAGFPVDFDAESKSVIITVGKEFFIDPVTIATTSRVQSPSATDYYEGERRLVKVGDVLFAFYDVVGLIRYKSSTDEGNTWSSEVSTTVRPVGSDSYRWTIVYSTKSGNDYISLAYWASDSISSGKTYFKVRTGTVNGATISWSAVKDIFNVNNNSACSPGTCPAVVGSQDTNGNIYLAFRYFKSGATYYNYQIFKSTNSGSTWTMSLGETSSGSTTRISMGLTELAAGKMLFVYARYSSTDFYYQVFDGTSAWGTTQVTSGAGMTTNVAKQISADSDSTNTAIVAYLTGGTTGSLKVAKWTNTGTFSAFETADNTLSHSLPGITITDDGSIRIYSLSGGKVYETNKQGTSWSNPSNPFGTTFTSPDQLTAAISYPGGLWREGTASPYNIRFDKNAAGALADRHSEIITELDQIGKTLNGTSITQGLIDDINSELTSLEDVATDLQNLGFDGYISAERIGGEVVGTVKFNSSGSSEPLIETQIPDGTIGIFMVMSLAEGFALYGSGPNSTQLADLLNASSIFADVFATSEDEPLASDIVLASISNYYPSSGNTVYLVVVVPYNPDDYFGKPSSAAVVERTGMGLNNPGMAEVLANIFEYGVNAFLWVNYPYVVTEGVKFNDLNGNGIRDSPTGEPGLGSFTFTIHTTIGLPDPFIFELFHQHAGSAIAVSNSTGHFSFDGARVPRFVEQVVIVEEETSGWEVTTPEFGLAEVIFEDPGPILNPLLQPIGAGTFETDPVEFGNRFLGKSLVFNNAAGTLVRVLNNPDYQNLSEMSVSLWIKQFSDDSAGNYAAKSTSWSLVQTTTRKVAINYFGTNADSTPNNVIVPGTWQHVVVTINPTAPDGNWRKIYINGVRLDTITSGGSIGPIQNAGDLEFGSASHVKLADLRFYDLEISSSDVTNLYQGQNVAGGLVSHWQLTEGSGTSVSDSIGGHTGTLIGGVTWDTDKPF